MRPWRNCKPISNHEAVTLSVARLDMNGARQMPSSLATANIRVKEHSVVMFAHVHQPVACFREKRDEEKIKGLTPIQYNTGWMYQSIPHQDH